MFVDFTNGHGRILARSMHATQMANGSQHFHINVHGYGHGLMALAEMAIMVLTLGLARNHLLTLSEALQ